MATNIKKTQVWLDMTEKVEVADFLAANPKDSYKKIAEIFSERLNKCLNKMHIYRVKKDEASIRSRVLKNKMEQGSRKI